MVTNWVDEADGCILGRGRLRLDEAAAGGDDDVQSGGGGKTFGLSLC